MIKVVDWNIGYRYQPLQELLDMDADIALLQEVGIGMRDRLAAVGCPVATSPHDPWEPAPKSDYDRWPLVVKLSNRVEIEWFKQVRATVPMEQNGEMAVNCGGTVAAARIKPLEGGEPFIAVSIYARWFAPHPTVGGWIYSDAAAHHAISDLSSFIPDYDAGTPKHRILSAGDFNMEFDFGHGTDPFARRANTVFDRMNALGLEYMGPQYPNGRRANPTPDHLPEDTRNVVTYYRGNSPETARLQLDHVFASRGFHNSVRTRAMNGVDEWGSSDHCRILIEIDE